MREAIDSRIRAVLPGDRGAIASALITGKRDAISTPVNDAMYISSLAHVLSISGYHMAVVAGIVFFVVRALLALVPVARHAPADQEMGGAAALVAALFYLLLSGAEVATQRSFIMIAIVLLGVMMDRPALTFRTLTLAALGVLLLAPRGGGASELPDVVCGDARADRRPISAACRGQAGADTPLGARVALWGGREVVGADPGVAGRRPRHHALCGLSFSSARALRRAGQPAGDADRLGGGDAGRHARR